LRYLVRCATLPLAVYREVAAHLTQVDGVSTQLEWQTADQFDYDQSQIGGLQIELPTVDDDSVAQVEQILAYYADRYSPWERLDA
jgi:hypothetical protein